GGTPDALSYRSPPLPLGWGGWGLLRGRLLRGRRGLQGNCRLRGRRGGRLGRRLRQCLVEHRLRRGRALPHELQQEGERNEEPARPPARLGQQGGGLTRADERVRRRRRAAE